MFPRSANTAHRRDLNSRAPVGKNPPTRPQKRKRKRGPRTRIASGKAAISRLGSGSRTDRPTDRPTERGRTELVSKEEEEEEETDNGDDWGWPVMNRKGGKRGGGGCAARRGFQWRPAASSSSRVFGVFVLAR
ncbi:hypothetical protein NL676_003072 [Syzygium grande]|nr:hypothetical protein NL676_003072 [Syzygium grande]